METDADVVGELLKIEPGGGRSSERRLTDDGRCTSSAAGARSSTATSDRRARAGRVHIRARRRLRRQPVRVSSGLRGFESRNRLAGVGCRTARHTRTGCGGPRSGSPRRCRAARGASARSRVIPVTRRSTTPSHARWITPPGSPWSSSVRGFTPAGAASAAPSRTSSACRRASRPSGSGRCREAPTAASRLRRNEPRSVAGIERRSGLRGAVERDADVAEVVVSRQSPGAIATAHGAPCSRRPAVRSSRMRLASP